MKALGKAVVLGGLGGLIVTGLIIDAIGAYYLAIAYGFRFF